MSQTDEGVEDLPEDEEDYEEDEEEEEEEVEEEEEHWSLYNSASFISGPIKSERCSIGEDVLRFHFSFGYNCRKYFNLTNPDPDTLIFASGNFITFFDVLSKTISFRRSALGGGIAHIKANPHPDFSHVAIAENGFVPLIIIYEWPTMEIVSVLKGGSSKLYSHLDYSPDGGLLVSQGGEPDYLITVWDWSKRRILLRTKSYVNDVYRVKFSPYCPGHLTTCGIAHIKFWKMSRTFTGLKLKGEQGRFGKTEFSDILGVLPMPDEKVVSGCAWGNILVWDAGLIKLEVFRTLRRKCHDGPIVQISFNEGELTTVAMDGHVKVWWYEKIDQADPPDDDRVIQIEPTYDFYTSNLMLMCIRKRYPDPKDTTYFAQDGNGGIWIIDLNTDETPKESTQLYRCHAGKVVAIAACPWGPYVVSLGEDGRIYLYAYLKKQIIFDYQYPARGTTMLWIPTKISPHGDELIMGFDDGTIRLSILAIKEDATELKITQTIKPHEKAVTIITINPSNTTLVTGSEDCTIFFFQIKSHKTVEIVPIGYIRIPNPVTCFTWHCKKENEVIAGCLHGEIIYIEAPKEPQPYTTVSYLLVLPTEQSKFTTYKAQIRRDIKLREIEARKAVKVAKKRAEMEKLKAENPGLDIDEEVFLADSETEEELEPLYIPEVPNRIIWLQSVDEDRVWLSMGGYDAGYIYEYTVDQKSEVPYFFKMVDDADDIEISSYIYNYNKKYLIFAMQDGVIRVNKLQNGDYHDLSDYWSVAMHDNQNGFIPNMCFSYDEKYFFSCGHDGNIFSYTFHPENEDYIPETRHPPVSPREVLPQSVPDEANYDKLSLEQASLKKEQDRIDRLAARHREIYREKLRKLRERFLKVLQRNKKLLPSQRIPLEELEVDRRVTEYLDMKLEEELALVKRKLAFDVQKSELRMLKLKEYFIDNLVFNPIIIDGLQIDLGVKMLRQTKIALANEEMLKIVDEKIYEEDLKSRPPERPPPPSKITPPKKPKEQGLEYFLKNLELGVLESEKHNKLKRLLQKYRTRKLKWERREDEWEEFLAKKPLPGVNHPNDDAALARAKMTIGDYKLKSNDNYKPNKEERATTVRKYKELLLARVKQWEIRYNFNKKVRDLRDTKEKIIAELDELQAKLSEMHGEIPEKLRKEAPRIRKIQPAEYPERNFEINVELEIEEDEKQASEAAPAVVSGPRDFDEHEKEVLRTRARTSEIKDPGLNFAQIDFETLCNLAKGEKVDTFWESDVRKRRLERKLFEQDEIIKTMNRKIKHFDDLLEQLNDERVRVEVDAKLMDVFMVTIHQELIILKEFETIENSLQAKVNGKISEVLDHRDMIDDTNARITERNKRIDQANDNMRILQMQFVQSTQDNKFYEFLKKVFKKKYRPPKVRKDDDSSSDESSSTSTTESDEEEDAKSVDSRDFAIMKQDLNVCPKGCDPAIFEFTVEQRSKRHKEEIAIKEELKMIDNLKKDLEIQNKKIKIIEKDLKNCEDELEKFQKQKQKKLNEIRCTVVLRLHQLQHLTPENKTSGIMDALIFSKTRLTQLYRRVEELQTETEQQIKRHTLDVKHYTRMKTDCDFMSRKIKKLQEAITDRMKSKFGKVIDINEIEEAMLKRTFGKDDLHDLEEVLLKKIAHDLRLSLMDIKGMYAGDLRYWQEQIFHTQKELTYALQYNTSQQELMTFLTKEKAELSKTLISQEKKKQHLIGVEDVMKRHNEEIERLEKVVEDQNQQLEELRDEIKLLKTKGMVLKPKESKKEPLEDETTKVWEHLDLEVEEEEEEKKKPFSTEIVIPTTLHDKAKEIASELIHEMLDALNLQLAKKSTENIVKDVLSSVMRGISVADLIDELIQSLSIEPDDTQRDIIETTAEQLYVVGEPDVTEEDPYYYAKEIMEDIVDEILLMKGEPESVIATMITKLVDQLPIEFLQLKSSSEYLVSRLLESHLNAALNHLDLEHMLNTQEAKNILEDLLQTVFDKGVDLLYYIKDH